jgi:glucose-1-phosphate adenylyltransferase
MKTRVVILAGGEGSRLGTLTAKRTKPAVPFAGKYRIIDFTLSNCVNSDLYDVMLIAQYRPHSLIEHIGAGGPWDLNRDFSGGVRIYTPYKGRGKSNWFTGTADALQQNYSFIMHNDPDLILILSGDHIYAMDYEPLITFHLDHRADLTMATIRVTMEEASRFGIVHVGESYQVTGFVEKPKLPPSTLANMGVYLFNAKVLDKVLWEDHSNPISSHDFGKDIIPKMIADNFNIFAYPYSGYWVDVGTTQSYWQAHMDLLRNPPPINLNNRSWVIHTRTEERPPVYIAGDANIRNSMITDGCVISENTEIVDSILSPGVVVQPGAKIHKSIILTDSKIGRDCHISCAIVDKRVTIGQSVKIGEFQEGKPMVTTVGKACVIPDNMIIEAGAALDIELGPADFQSNLVKRNEVILRSGKQYDGNS